MCNSSRPPRIVAVVGQTASGKSDLALDIAEYLDGVIIGADALQLYRGLDIGTAKIPLAERRGIPHYFLEELSVFDDASVATYQRKGRQLLESLEQPAVVAGGSGLYLRALLDQMEFPAHDAAVRAQLEAEAEELGKAPLHQRLSQLDPPAAQMIHPHNVRRVIRALEAIAITGKPFSATLPQYLYHYPNTVQVGIRWEQELLDERIRLRARRMFAEGLVEEARLLLDVPPLATARRATGYAEALAVIAGELTEAEAIEKVALATRQLSMRQSKWFRRDPRIHWFAPGPHLREQVLELLDRNDPETLA